ncbi:formylglycine-generating enzyme family protein [Zafaria sp. Z1313]|uniref:formylglycine-generating enzyme family protein n=1 Tax=unclassified Zafaria TaxID=2828765 RepID=UPI002E759957|nr:SUMF1/EgtB/PvdO family nonheme iron enzyme [Zafaria sp. J156]MEE1621315.1 SUMF1/EgtB/PvdO family nonheme iron enzyme [Zafaria sp. J156]
MNTQDDGFLTTAPVRTFEPNGFGLWQSVGNVWEWCPDWFDPDYHRHSPGAAPAGPDQGQARLGCRSCAFQAAEAT